MTPFRQTYEFTVAEFETGVGFYISVFGLETVVLFESYALFPSPQHDVWFSVRKASVEFPESNPSGRSLMFMSQDFAIVRDYIDQVGAGIAIADRVELSGQRFSRFQCPSGLAIELLEDLS